MSQGKVTDFFSTRKRNPASQPSKRRKVEITSSEVDISSLTKTNTNPYRNLTREEADCPALEDQRQENTVFSPLQTRAARKAKSVSIPKNKTRTRNVKIDSKQKLISESFASSGQVKGDVTLTEDVTSAWDDHDADTVTATPQKAGTSETVARSRKRTRTTKKAHSEILSDEATPEKLSRQPPESTEKTDSKARKQLQMKHIPSQISELQNPIERPADTPVETRPLEEQSKPTSAALKNIAATLEKCKNLQTNKHQTVKSSVEEMKAKLGKVTNLDDLKQRLALMKETREKIQAPKLQKFDKVEIKTESDVKPAVPAYEKFHHLATPAAPTLSLPYKYRLLAEQFRGTDQVVSMLHNRNEICTFSKLKAAVQELTKRNFETKHLAQIKTVYPDAYELRQEKGLQNMQGFREPGYQLTVEARLNGEDDKKKGKETFMASHLLSRRNVFHNDLINIVKKHHKEFLANLSHPLSIPDDKITRWHPRFPLDEVPDIPESPLPQPPDVQTLQTAQDVLQSTRGKVDPKIVAALKATVKEEEKSQSVSNSPSKPITPSSTNKPAAGNLKGVPLSLLEKIRAKEAANTTAALTRDPKAEKRLVMMKRLPDIMRIIRSQFVTDKKPALTVDSVIQRILDSYKSCLALGDIEPHIDLCIELVPEWISMVQIKKGKYLKIDRNIELQHLVDKVNNIAKGKSN